MENLAGYALEVNIGGGYALEANIGGVSMLPGADGKSAYAYAVEGGYTGTEEEFAKKLAEEMPTALPNPNALTFTGAVTGSYDGSEALTIEIPSGSNFETVESQLVDIPYKLSQLENDAGYLTLDTLPKYDGSVIAE